MTRPMEALTCTVAVPQLCGKPAAEVLWVKADACHLPVPYPRCADHPAAEWLPIIKRMHPGAMWMIRSAP